MKNLNTIIEGMFDIDDNLEKIADQSIYNELKEKLNHKYHEEWTEAFVEFFDCSKPINVKDIKPNEDFIVTCNIYTLITLSKVDCSFVFFNEIKHPDLWKDVEDTLQSIYRAIGLDEKYYNEHPRKYNAYRLDKDQVKKAVGCLMGWMEEEKVNPRKHICAKIRKINKIVNK